MVFQVGSWTLWLAINKAGRFPNIDQLLSDAAVATARCTLSTSDARFLAQTLPRLPGDETDNWAVTLDLNGSIAIRARAADQPRPTEIVLAGSSWTGEPVRLNTNRKYLGRAMKLGFREVLIFGNKVPALCQDECREYLWAILDPESAIKPTDDVIRIASPECGFGACVRNPQTSDRKESASHVRTRQSSKRQWSQSKQRPRIGQRAGCEDRWPGLPCPIEDESVGRCRPDRAGGNAGARPFGSR